MWIINECDIDNHYNHKTAQFTKLEYYSRSSFCFRVFPLVAVSRYQFTAARNWPNSVWYVKHRVGFVLLCIPWHLIDQEFTCTSFEWKSPSIAVFLRKSWKLNSDQLQFNLKFDQLRPHSKEGKLATTIVHCIISRSLLNTSFLQKWVIEISNR